MFLGKKVRVLLKDQAKEAFSELENKNNKESQSLLRSINRVVELLKENPQSGNPLAKNLIPENFIKEGVHNLYRAELSNFWRMLYTLEGNENEIFVFILNIVDHPTYNKIFGYRK